MTPYIAITRARSGPVIAANDRLASWPIRGGTDILGHLLPGSGLVLPSRVTVGGGRSRPCRHWPVPWSRTRAPARGLTGATRRPGARRWDQDPPQAKLPRARPLPGGRRSGAQAGTPAASSSSWTAAEPHHQPVHQPRRGEEPVQLPPARRRRSQLPRPVVGDPAKRRRLHPEQAKAAALQVLPDILHYDRPRPTAASPPTTSTAPLRLADQRQGPAFRPQAPRRPARPLPLPRPAQPLVSGGRSDRP